MMMISTSSDFEYLPSREFCWAWHWLTRLPGRKGKACRIVGKRHDGILLVEFEDGFRTTCSPNALRRRIAPPVQEGLFR